MQQEQSEQFKVAPIISQQKLTELKSNILQTLTGIHSNNISLHRIEQLLILFPITFIVPLIITNKTIAIILPTIFNVIFNLLQDLFRSEPLKIASVLIRNSILGVYTFLWTSHIYFLIQYCNNQPYNIVFSAISILTSIYTIARDPVKQFSTNGFENTEIGWNSTLYMRFFIVFPTLLAEFIIFNSSDQTSISPDNSYLFPLRIVNSLIFVVWWLGWISSLRNTFTFICDKIGMLIFGNQSQLTFRLAISGVILNMIPIAIYQIIGHRNETISLNPLIIGASVTSVISFLKTDCMYSTIGKKSIRPIILMLFQMLVCALLALLYRYASLQNANLSIFLGIDIGLYLVFKFIKQLSKARSIFGISFSLQKLTFKYVALLERISLRIISGLSILILLVNYSQEYLPLFPYNQNILNYAILPFLGFRSFKRCISQTTSFSLHISLLICLIAINTGVPAQGTLLVLMMPPFPPNAWTAFLSIFRIPPKLKHQNEFYFQILYFISTLIGLGLHFVSFGTLQMTMVFGLPVYWATIPTETEGNEVKSLQNSLYQKIIQNIDNSLFMFYQKGFYLIRIQKYILLLEIKSNCFGFCEILDFRGLQVQEVTSCHSKQGQTIDKLAEQTWGDNKQCCSFAHYDVALTPFLQQKIFVPTENDMQLVGIIQSKQFVNLFKQTLLKSITRQLTKITLNEQQKRQAEVIAGQLSAIYKKDAAQSLFPFQFAKACNISAAYPLQVGKVKLPPLAKGKKPEVINDFLDLLENSNNDKFQTSNTALGQKQKSITDQTRKQIKQPKLDELNLAIILTFYYYTFGKQDYINTDKLYKLIKRQTDVVSQIQFQNFNKIISLALGSALKISIDKYIDGQFQTTIQDFQNYDQTSFLGTSDTEQFKRAILEDREHVWSINYSKKSLSIKRLAHSQTKMFIFKVDQLVLKSVWNNLRFQLIYATNNNDERYSIQTHPNLLRNLWVEACQEPFGYPSYHSGLMINK